MSSKALNFRKYYDFSFSTAVAIVEAVYKETGRFLVPKNLKQKLLNDAETLYLIGSAKTSRKQNLYFKRFGKKRLSDVRRQLLEIWVEFCMRTGLLVRNDAFRYLKILACV